MNVYFIRHGETKLNRNNIHQPNDTQLSDVGREQSQNLGALLKDKNIEVIYSSPITRALQSAQIISNKLGVEIELNGDLKEVKRPSEIVGKSHNDSQVLTVKEQIRLNYHLSDWHHSDEENFRDLEIRAINFISFLKRINKKNIAVVSHGMIIKLILAKMIFDDTLTPEEFLKFYNHISLSNTGLTFCEFSMDDNKWRINSINNTSHYIL